MKIVVSEFMTLDGVVQAPGGPEEDTDGGFAHGGWSMPFFEPDSMGRFLDATMATTEALLFGRRTWQTMAAAWPDRAGDAFADRMNAITKYVASTTLQAADLHWANSVLLPADSTLAAIVELRAREGGDLQVMGSADLVTSLVSDGLVDEYRLMIEPIIVGGGKRIFPTDGAGQRFSLVDTSTTDTGVLMCTYRPTGD